MRKVCKHHMCTNPRVIYLGLGWWFCKFCKSEWYHDCTIPRERGEKMQVLYVSLKISIDGVASLPESTIEKTILSLLKGLKFGKVKVLNCFTEEEVLNAIEEKA